ALAARRPYSGERLLNAGHRRGPRVAGWAEHRVASRQDGHLLLRVPVAPRHVSALPLRPDHAARLEGADPRDDRLDRRRGRDGGFANRPVVAGLRKGAMKSLFKTFFLTELW